MSSPDRATPHAQESQPIAPPQTRRRRATRFQYYELLALAIFTALAVLAHSREYFSFDLVVTRALQTYKTPAFAGLMYALTWLGFTPQAYFVGGAVIAGLSLAGLRWEAVTAAFAASVALLVVFVKWIVSRPRPSSDLVEVLSQLLSPSFPSGHVTQCTAFCGFLLFLAYTLLKPSWIRVALLVVLATIVLLMGPSRIYLGQHWFSDVMGAYVLGGLWLAITIRIYRWGKPRFFTRQPLAPVSQ